MRTKVYEMSSAANFTCHICYAQAAEVPDYASFRRVASDCRPFRKDGHLGVCKSCGSVQKNFDATWQAEIEEIYRNYQIYHQSSGLEQAVFELNSGQAEMRSEKILSRLTKLGILPKQGKLLDIGCANGALLRAFSRNLPQWELFGSELDEKYKAEVESIPNFKEHYVATPENIPGTYDLLALIHVLEHVADPIPFLRQLKARLKPEGRLFVELPCYELNPFDLLIADHGTHFDLPAARFILEAAGFEVEIATTEWMPKEIALLAKVSEKSEPQALTPGRYEASLEKVRQRLDYLRRVLSVAEELSSRQPLGLFGTAIAATWLATELGDRVDFFVDEDPSRSGRSYMQAALFRPAEVPSGAQVFIPLAPEVASSVCQRLKRDFPQAQYFIPWERERERD